MSLYYRIADHIIAVKTTNPDAINDILPSFQPFRMEALHSGDPIFVLENGYSLTPHGELLQTFDWEDTQCTMYRTEKGYFVTLINLQTGVVEMMESQDNWHTIHTSLQTNSHTAGFFMSYFMMMAFGFASAFSNTLMMHASVIEANGKGMLFLGKSGTGKSTHSRLWLQHVAEARLLNDDNPIVRLMPDGRVYVFGSPWSGKTPCYRNHGVEVGSFVRIKQAPCNKLLKMPVTHAFATIFPSCSNMIWDKEIHDAVCHTVATVAVKSKVARLECLPDGEAVKLSHSLL